MEINRDIVVDTFVKLGEKLDTFEQCRAWQQVIADAIDTNEWFTLDEVKSSLRAIGKQMLQKDKLHKWLDTYDVVEQPKKVAIIMAGNIPLVGFFDMLCVVISGHTCYIKPSSKDKVLIEYIVKLLKSITPSLPIYSYDNQEIDALIATGSNNTKRYFESHYKETKKLLRGSRTSVAIVSGQESKKQLELLAYDIFQYSGLGCRNVSHILLPDNYDTKSLIEALSNYSEVNPKFKNNFIQRLAILKMQEMKHLAGDFFILRKSEELPSAISEVTYNTYNDIESMVKWLEMNDEQLQCVVYDKRLTPVFHTRWVEFGKTQSPTLTDYADDVDVMRFLLSI